MILIFLMLFALLFVSIVRRRHNKISLNIGLFMAAMLLNSFVLLTYIGKLSMLEYAFDFEFLLLKEFYKVNISYYDLRFLSNVSIILFSAANVWFYINVSKRNNIWIVYPCIMFLVSIVMLYLNSDYFSEGLFIAGGNGSLTKGEISFIKRIVMFVNYTVIIFPAGFVDMYLLQKSMMTRTVIIRKNSLMHLGIVLAFQMFFMYFYVFSPVGEFVNRLEITIPYTINSGGDIYYFTVAILLLAASLLFVFFGDILEPIDFRKKTVIKKRMEIQFCDIRHVFHTYKNVFLGIKTINSRSLRCESIEDARANIELINKQCERMVHQISSFIGMYNTPKLNLRVAKLNDIVKKSVHDAKNVINIQVHTNFECDMSVYVDESYLSEAFYNIIKNADEASDKSDAWLNITVWQEGNYVCISFKDNGSGVLPRQKRSIFNPFTTTKGTHKNSGIGLTYVKNIVEAHLGFVDIESKAGSYFDLQIILPIEREECV